MPRLESARASSKTPFIAIAFVALLLTSGCSFFSNFSTKDGPSETTRTDGRLAPCPDEPNCVIPQVADANDEHGIVPFTYSKSLDEAKAALKTEIAEMPGMTLVKDEAAYLHFESRSRVLRLVDDVEFIFDDQAKILHFRSGSRIGHSDWGSNRARMEEIRNKVLGRI